MDYDPNLPLPGQRRIPRYWFMWAWCRAVAAMLAVVIAGFLGSKWTVSPILKHFLQSRRYTPDPMSAEQIRQAVSTMVGFDITAPVHVQFGGYAADVFLYAPVLAVFVLSGVFAVAMTWQRRR